MLMTKTNASRCLGGIGIIRNKECVHNTLGGDTNEAVLI